MSPPAPPVLVIEPLRRPPRATVQVPGSKSITNRSLLLAALADGVSTLERPLVADDTEAMAAAVTALGARIDRDDAWRVRGTGGSLRTGATIHARDSGTTARFIAPVLAAAAGRSTLDGSAQLRKRPMQPLFEALRQLGAGVEETGSPGHLPSIVTGPAAGGPVDLPGDISSQFVSGLLMAAPLMRDGVAITLTSPLVSAPFLEMTRSVMLAFGVEASGDAVAPAPYRATAFTIEPDATAASYFFAAAAITGGEVTVDGLGRHSIQGDLRFVDVLERMGARVDASAAAITVSGAGPLLGVDVDLRDLPDTALTLAAVAVFAESPTRVRGIDFARGHESDRIAAAVTELRRCGITADEHDDGFTVHPSPPRPAVVQTYGDHRMAMSFSLLGLRAPGIAIADPACVAKTYPRFFDDLASLHR